MDTESQKEIREALRAKEILEDPILQGAFDKLEEQYIQAWKDSKAKNKDDRDTLWHLVWAIAELRTHLSVIIQRGEFQTGQLQKSLKQNH